jgi:hypothetical protein
MHFPYAPSARPDGAFFVPDPPSGHGRIGSVNRLPLVVAVGIPLLAVSIDLAGLPGRDGPDLDASKGKLPW